MRNKLKHIEWKTLIIGIIATLIIILSIVSIASLTVDIVFLSKHDVSYTFSIFSKEDWGFFHFNFEPGIDNSRFVDDSRNFYTTRFPIISMILSALGFLLGGFVTGKIVKDNTILHGVLSGAVLAVLFLSWLTVIFIFSSYLGAVLAKHSKINKLKSTT